MLVTGIMTPRGCKGVVYLQHFIANDCIFWVIQPYTDGDLRNHVIGRKNIVTRLDVIRPYYDRF